MPVLSIFYISLFIFFISFYLYRINMLTITLKELGSIFVFSVLLNFLSFMIKIEKIGGTVLYEARGWPHFFYQYQIKDVLDGVLINKGYFIMGNFFLYIISNVLFYFSIIFFILFLYKKIRKSLQYINK